MSERVTSVMAGPNGECGLFERGYDAETRTVDFTYAFREDLPAWIEAGKPLVPDKGTPTHLYSTLRIMKLCGVGFGEARRFRLLAIHEVKSILHLDWLLRKHPEVSPAELVSKTHSCQYAWTPITQSGHRITRIRLDATHAVRGPIGNLLVHYEQMAPDRQARAAAHDRLLAEVDRTRADVMLYEYDIILEVKPWTK